MENIFFNSWQNIFRTFIVAVIVYLAVIFILRITGKRTVSKMNAFDFLITVALGSTLATVALNSSVALVEGVFLIFIPVLLQYSVTWLSVRFRGIKKLVTESPSLLVYKGQIIEKAMKEERITIEELHLVARQKGFSRIKDIDAVILEPTGILTVIEKLPGSGIETLSSVKKTYADNYPEKEGNNDE